MFRYTKGDIMVTISLTAVVGCFMSTELCPLETADVRRRREMFSRREMSAASRVVAGIPDV